MSVPERRGILPSVFVIPLLLLACGCVANRVRRDHDSRPWATKVPIIPGQLDQFEPAGSRPNQNYDLSYIEFDEQGDYWDRRQLGWTAQAITSTSSGIGRACALLLACEGLQMFEGIGVKGKK